MRSCLVKCLLFIFNEFKYKSKTWTNESQPQEDTTRAAVQ